MEKPHATRSLTAALWLAGSLFLAVPEASAALTLIATNATWSFQRGTNEASLPDTTAWRSPSFDDSSWADCPAMFYYGKSGFTGTELTDMRRTDTQTGYTCIYLRQTFFIADPALVAYLFLNAACDDGFIAWINGTQVASMNAPADPITYQSLANTYVGSSVNYVTYPVADPLNVLVAGANVLAIQVFNYDPTSSDLVFDTELLADLTADPPLGLIAVSPAPGLLTNLTTVAVTFTEPVTGVQAGDLLLNGIGATNVAGAGASYAFSFAQPTFGQVLASWSPQNLITTVAAPPRVLQPNTPGVSWSYQLVDVAGPTVLSTHPPAYATVRRMTQVEVVFDQAVRGVDAADLLVNGLASTNVFGYDAGPYVFQFPAPPTGVVAFAWSATHGIESASPLPSPLTTRPWQTTLDPQQPPGDVVLNEFLAWNLTNWNDEDGDRVPWIELHNRGSSVVDLSGWALTDSADNPGKWILPSYLLPPGGFLTVFASGKDRRIAGPGRPLHTNFKLGQDGEYLGLFSPDSPRQVVCDFNPEYPPQAADNSYGLTPSGQWRYLMPPTPDQPNPESLVSNRVDAVHFSVPRGFFDQPFHLSLCSPTFGATIRYTLDGSTPSATNGLVYAAPILIDTSRVVCAVAFRHGWLPSATRTHTYLYGLPANRRQLPALSIVTAPGSLYGPSGIMETNPRNTTRHGIAWERPASIEWIRPEDNGGFQEDCGLRVAGGDYIRTCYGSTNVPPWNKYSFRLYFRGDYGAGRLRYPLFPDTGVDSFDVITLRAGMNDPVNPFLRDELVRRLAADLGQPNCHGTFVNLFLNGVYQGYYNPTERIDEDFLQSYHGGGTDWEIIDQTGEAAAGSKANWEALRLFVANSDLLAPTNYLQLGRQLDLTNFVDYVLPHLYANTGDWPYNNWRAAREHVPEGIFRFYVWDAEWSFGYQNSINGFDYSSPTQDAIANQLSSLAVPHGETFVQEIFNRLKGLPEFQLLFADRVHQHLFHGGALTDDSIRQRYEELRRILITTIAGFNDTIGTSWIPTRRRYLLQHLADAGFLRSSNAPVFSPFGGRVAAGAPLTMTSPDGTIYYTTNGTDPRVMFSGAIAPDAQPYHAAVPLSSSVLVKARTLTGSNWSALTDAAFHVETLGVPVRFAELMYNPVGNDACEFIELQNVGQFPVSLEGCSLTGVDFRFPVGTPALAAGARLVLASAKNPAAFAARYPGLTVAGYFDGSLANGGERLALLDASGGTVCALEYGDDPPWPVLADGGGASLEAVDPLGDLNDPANWQAGGSPGQPNAVPSLPTIRLNELMALNVSAVTNGATCPDWIELHNAGTASVDLQGWSLTDAGDPRAYPFPTGTTIPAGGYLIVWCDSNTNAPGLHSGFALNLDGETVALYDANTNRVDVVTFGPQVPNLTVGRGGASAAWQLCEPTPGTPNEAAPLGAQADLVLNELLAKPGAGQDDWLELHNRNLSLPVPLHGLYFKMGNTLCRLLGPAFVAPGGYVQLHADEQPGPGHLALKLPAEGGTLVLADAAGGELDQLTYGAQTEGVSAGRLPDGTGPLTAFPGSASPGAANYARVWTGPVLNEFLARNKTTVTNAAGQFRDWIELHNPLATNFDLSAHSLSVGRPDPGEWPFPTGTIIPAGGYLIVWCDETQPATTNANAELNLGRSLAAEGEQIHLFDPDGQALDSVAFGFQLVDQSVGRTPEGWRLLAAPTPGRSNAAPAILGSTTHLHINEWMAAPVEGDDWFELYNPAPLPVDLAGLFLTDDPSASGHTNSPIGPLTFVPPLGFVRWIADGQTDKGPNHVNFSLDELGESLRLNAGLNNVIDGIDYHRMPAGVSAGRWPDGAPDLVWFHETPTPAESNYLPHPAVVVHEVLTHTDPPLEDAIEVRNSSRQPVDLGGWFLSNQADALRRCRIPANTIVPAEGFTVLYEILFNPHPAGTNNFTLNSAHGDTVYLSEADAEGRLTGYRAVARVGAAANGVSFGRVETSLGVDWAPLSARTFGVDTPATLPQFRTGRGRTNAPPLVGPIVISEIMYHPVAGPANALTETPDDEYLELHNATAAPVPLYDPAHAANTWRIAGGIDYEFPMGVTLATGETVLVVPFDPVADTETANAFRLRYGLSDTTRLWGPYDGQLSNRGEALELLRPDAPQEPPHPDAGYVPQLRADYVLYGSRAPWPIEADGSGWSLQRRRPLAYGNEPLFWKAAPPTPGRVLVDPADLDTDNDGLPDAWEDAYALDRLDPADASLDPDQDGFSNLEEHQAGTNPQDPASALALEITTTPEEFCVRFHAQADRSYSIQSTDTLGSGSWVELGHLAPQSAATWVELYLPRTESSPQRLLRLVTPAQQ